MCFKNIFYFLFSVLQTWAFAVYTVWVSQSEAKEAYGTEVGLSPLRMLVEECWHRNTGYLLLADSLG